MSTSQAFISSGESFQLKTCKNGKNRNSEPHCHGVYVSVRKVRYGWAVQKHGVHVTGEAVQKHDVHVTGEAVQKHGVHVTGEALQKAYTYPGCLRVLYEINNVCEKNSLDHCVF